MKTAKAQKPQGQLQQAGTAQSPKPVKSWSKVAAGGQQKPVTPQLDQQHSRQPDEQRQEPSNAHHGKLINLLAKLVVRFFLQQLLSPPPLSTD